MSTAGWESAGWSWISAGVEIGPLLNPTSPTPPPLGQQQLPTGRFLNVWSHPILTSLRGRPCAHLLAPPPVYRWGKRGPEGPGSRARPRWHQGSNSGLTGFLHPVPAELQGGTLTTAAPGKTPGLQAPPGQPSTVRSFSCRLSPGLESRRQAGS